MHRYIIGLALAVAIGLALAVAIGAVAYAQQAFTNLQLLGHVLSGNVGASVPTVTNGTLASGSTDTSGLVTLSGTSAPVLTFGTAYNQIPFCVVNDNAGETSEGIMATATKTTLTFVSKQAGGTFPGGDVLSYLCLATTAN